MTGFVVVTDGGVSERLVSLEELEAPRLFESVALSGGRVLAINFYPGAPLLPLPGAELANIEFFTPRALIHGRLLEEVLGGAKPPGRGMCGLEGYAELVERYRVAAERAARSGVSLFWLLLRYPDSMLHPCPEGVEKVLGAEEELLGALGGLIETLMEEYETVVLVSDHGFGVYRRVVHVNRVLEEAGLARFTRDASRAPPVTRPGGEEVRLVDPRVVMLVKRLGLAGVARRLARLYRRVTGRSVMTGLVVDWYESKALMPFGGMYGVVVRDGSRRTVERVVEALRGVEGLALVEPREDYDPGPLVKRHPHVIVIPDYWRGYSISPSYSEEPVEEKTEPDHHPDGILAVYPASLLPAVRETVTPPEAGVVLHALSGAPLPRGANTRIAEELGLEVRVGGVEAKWRLAKRLALRVAMRGVDGRGA